MCIRDSFGAILVNLPLSGAIDQMPELGIEVGALSELFRAGISNAVSYTHLDVYKRQHRRMLLRRTGLSVRIIL